ncbi:uncharacterized protein LOC128171930 [Crassostrea angulata]|uniref:uncharacterized protein LOC128171930 n=1 Tax=Magallana angulata TaxID=2784310 RepID=UPI0022B109CF|nr:uncharacterized protein LOC128171930 [Crassostrea angulata]
MVNILGISDSTDPEYSYMYGIKNEILQFRSIIKESKLMDSDSTKGLCGEKLAAEFCNVHEMCMKHFKDDAEEVSKTLSLQKRLKLKPMIISKKQNIISENFTKEELKTKIEEPSMGDTKKKEWQKIKKGKKRVS